MSHKEVLKDVSTISGAFNLAHFKKRESVNGEFHYLFLSFQFFFYDKANYAFVASSSLNSTVEFKRGSAEFDAFQDLSHHIDTYAETDGTLNYLNKLSKVSSAPAVKTCPVISNSFHSNSQFCACTSPEVVTSSALGKEFKYCRACKREKS